MAQATKIEWTDVSWNPVHGCSRVSTGCKNCYAETLSLRYGQTLKPWTARNAAENVLLKPHKLREPLSKAGPWKNPCRVFVNSMSDLFHEQIPDAYIAQVFAVMAAAERHTFQILTKRPERMRSLLSAEAFWLQVRVAGKGGGGRAPTVAEAEAVEHAGAASPLPNVWLGTSIENRKWVGRADVLRETPAAVRFISAEPLLGPLVARFEPEGCLGEWVWPDGTVHEGNNMPGLDLTGIDWLIVGGESGSGHRPFDVEWARHLRDAALSQCADCAALGGGYLPDDWAPRFQDDRTHWAPCSRHTAVFLKQLGGARPGTALEDLPEDLRMREFPADEGVIACG